MNLLRKYITMFRADIKEVMSRRCGLDELNYFIIIAAFILIGIALFSSKVIALILGAACVVLCFGRSFSKKVEQRAKENAFYMRYMGGIVKLCGYLKLCVMMKIKSIRDAEYVYFVCRSCGQIIRVPKGKNKVNIRCPKCSATFIKRT